MKSTNLKIVFLAAVVFNPACKTENKPENEGKDENAEATGMMGTLQDSSTIAQGQGTGGGTASGGGTITGGGNNTQTGQNPQSQNRTQPSPSNPPSNLGNSSPNSQAKTKEQCNAQGLVWVPVVNSQPNSASCGEQIAKDFNCTLNGILSYFSTHRQKIQNKLNEYTGFDLYNCGKPSSSKLRFHFMKKNGAETDYRWFEVTTR